MKRRSLVLALGLTSIAAPSHAAFHLWGVTEIFSNDDGTVQFVEFYSEDGGQEFLEGQDLETYQQNGMREQFTFPTSIPVPQGESTADRHFLVATPDFLAVAGITPDFEIPVGFLEPGIIDEVALVEADAMDFAAGALPTDGVNSLNDPGGGDPLFTAAATPTNFARQMGTIVPEPGADFAGAVALACVASLRRRTALAAR